MVSDRTIEVQRITSIISHKEYKDSSLTFISSSIYQIGHVVEGEKWIYVGEEPVIFHKGESYFLSIGKHYVKETISENGYFEEIIISVSRKDTVRIAAIVSDAMEEKIEVPCRQCGVCPVKRFQKIDKTEALPFYFQIVKGFLGSGAKINEKTIRDLLLTALLYILFKNPNRCIIGKMLGGKETDEEKFKIIIYSNIFTDIEIEELAKMTGLSQSLFKRKFKNLFGMSPHIWVNRERLKYSKFLLRATKETVDDIGKECLFPNVSHFSRCFKKEYGISPLQYRALNAKD